MNDKLVLSILQDLYIGYLSCFASPEKMKSFGRSVSLEKHAKRFSISDLLAIQRYVFQHGVVGKLKAWAYLLLSIALFLRKSEAASIKIEDLKFSRDPVTDEFLYVNLLPQYVKVNIVRSKTDQQASG